MNSQKYNKEELYPEDFTDEDKERFETYLEQAKVLFPKLVGDEWLIKTGIFAFMKKEKLGDVEPPSQEEIAAIRNRYTTDSVYYTEPMEPVEREPIEAIE